MRSNRIFYDISIVPVGYRDGVVDIAVETRDTWTLEPGVSASRGRGRQQNRLDGTGHQRPRHGRSHRGQPLHRCRSQRNPVPGLATPRFRRLDRDRLLALPAQRRPEQRDLDHPAVLRSGHALGGRILDLDGYSYRLRLQQWGKGRPVSPQAGHSPDIRRLVRGSGGPLDTPLFRWLQLSEGHLHRRTGHPSSGATSSGSDACLSLSPLRARAGQLREGQEPGLIERPEYFAMGTNRALSWAAR